MELVSGISVARGLKPAPWVLGARGKLSTRRPHHCLLPARGLTPAAGRASSSPPPATARFVYTSRAAPQAGRRPAPGGDIGQKLFGSVSGAGARAGSPAPGAPRRLHRGPARSPCGTVGAPVKLGGRRVPEPGLGSRAGPGRESPGLVVGGGVTAQLAGVESRTLRREHVGPPPAGLGVPSGRVSWGAPAPRPTHRTRSTGLPGTSRSCRCGSRSRSQCGRGCPTRAHPAPAAPRRLPARWRPARSAPGTSRPARRGRRRCPRAGGPPGPARPPREGRPGAVRHRGPSSAPPSRLRAPRGCGNRALACPRPARPARSRPLPPRPPANAQPRPHPPVNAPARPRPPTPSSGQPRALPVPV